MHCFAIYGRQGYHNILRCAPQADFGQMIALHKVPQGCIFLGFQIEISELLIGLKDFSGFCLNKNDK